MEATILFTNNKILMLLISILVIITYVTTQCTENSGVEILMDGKLLNSTVIYLSSSNNHTVGCRCTRGSGSPVWFYPNDTIVPNCNNTSAIQICIQSNGTIENLKFSAFKGSYAGQYNCSSKLVNIILGKFRILCHFTCTLAKVLNTIEVHSYTT